MLRLDSSVDSERGASLIIVAFVLILLMGVAALAIDLAGMRYDLRAAQLASDAAATAGAIQIDPVAGSDAQEACQVAWEYLLENIEDEGPTTSPPNCANFSGNCPASSRTEPASAGPYSFRIVHPVEDIHEFMGDQPINDDIDGGACQRLGVSVERTRDFTFGRLIGFVAGTPESSSVARIAVRPGEGELVPLLVLEPTKCEALSVKGGGMANAYIVVDSFNDVPGIIAVDSDGSSGPPGCGGSGYTIHANNTPNNWIRALDVPPPDSVPSAILSYALSGAPGANPARAYENADVDSNRIYPRPIPTPRRITRAAIDWRYNCQTSYPDYLGIVKVDGCTTGDAPHINNLRDQYGTGDPGFDEWTTCTVTGPLTISGDKWIRCPSGFVVQSGVVTFEGGDLVFEGGIQVKGNATQLIINPTPTADRVVFLRSGDLEKESHSTLTMNQVFVYMESGGLDLSGGGGGLTWIAPLLEDSVFEDLALWANSGTNFSIGGQSGNTLEGTFFTPFADPFRLTGTGSQLQTAAQFVARRLEAFGQAQVFMTPDPDRSTRLPIRGVMLIR
jgi:hypothetical protein